MAGTAHVMVEVGKCSLYSSCLQWGWQSPKASLLCAYSLNHVRLFVIPWTVACQASLSMGILQARILEWVVVASSRRSSQPRIKPMSLMSPALEGRFFTTHSTWEAPGAVVGFYKKKKGLKTGQTKMKWHNVQHTCSRNL